MDIAFKTLKTETLEKYILLITLNRPEFRNAINHQMMLDLQQLWLDLYAHHKNIRCIILTGSGDKAFCAGADLKERNKIDIKTWQQQHAALEQAMIAMMDCPIPIIAAVNGAAFGGGLELMLACDFAYAANTATFAQSEVKLGIIPGAGGTQNLPRACGIQRAKELCLSAVTFSAEQAFKWGVVNKLCNPTQLLNETLSAAKIICENAPLAVQQAKKALNASQQTDLKTGYAFELEAYNHTLATKDREEGVSAFNEKRKPKFTGE